MHQEDITRLKRQTDEQQLQTQIEQEQQSLVRQLNQLIKNITFNCTRSSVGRLKQLIQLARSIK